MIPYSLLISGIAFFVSFLSFYYAHLQGPKFKIIYADTIPKKEFNPITTELSHEVIFINQGNKTGIIDEIYYQPIPKGMGQVTVEMKKVEQDSYEKISTPVWLHPKDAMILKVKYNAYMPLSEIPDHILKTDVWEQSKFLHLSGLDLKKIDIERFDNNFFKELNS